MADLAWVIQTVFLLGFLHGLKGDHLIDVLNSKGAEEIYTRPSWISFRLGVVHLGYVLCFMVPFWLLWLLGIEAPIVHYSFSQPAVGIIFTALGLYSLYEFFFIPPKQLHQHDHHHKHEHGHLHSKEPPASAGGEGHVGHVHLPKYIDKPESVVPVALGNSVGSEQAADGRQPAASAHEHPHEHQHEHLHFHDPEANKNHSHQHYAGKMSRLGTLHNVISLLAVSMTALVFPLKEILSSLAALAAFLVGLFLAIYLLETIYRGMGIKLIGKIDRVATFLLGVVAGLIGFLLLKP
ncbi:MAG: hypothetical protein AB1847_09225 [bacterium]